MALELFNTCGVAAIKGDDGVLWVVADVALGVVLGVAAAVVVGNAPTLGNVTLGRFTFGKSTLGTISDAGDVSLRSVSASD